MPCGGRERLRRAVESEGSERWGAVPQFYLLTALYRSGPPVAWPMEPGRGIVVSRTWYEMDWIPAAGGRSTPSRRYGKQYASGDRECPRAEDFSFAGNISRRGFPRRGLPADAGSGMGSQLLERTGLDSLGGEAGRTGIACGSGWNPKVGVASARKCFPDRPCGHPSRSPTRFGESMHRRVHLPLAGLLSLKALLRIRSLRLRISASQGIYSPRVPWGVPCRANP